MLAFDGLNLSVQFMFVLSILVKLREHFSHIINEELGEFFVRLKDITEKLAVVIVNNVR